MSKQKKEKKKKRRKEQRFGKRIKLFQIRDRLKRGGMQYREKNVKISKTERNLS